MALRNHVVGEVLTWKISQLLLIEKMVCVEWYSLYKNIYTCLYIQACVYAQIYSHTYKEKKMLLSRWNVGLLVIFTLYFYIVCSSDWFWHPLWFIPKFHYYPAFHIPFCFFTYKSFALYLLWSSLGLLFPRRLCLPIFNHQDPTYSRLSSWIPSRAFPL